MILFIKIVVMPSSSFLIVCLMKDIAMIVNHKLILYSSMSFLFARIVCFSSILVYRSWNLLLFCGGIYESKKACRKILFNFLRGLNPLCNVVCFLWNWYTQCLTNSSIFCMSLLQMLLL